MALNRDVMVHGAVTIVPRINGIHLPPVTDPVTGKLKSQPDMEVCQFAFELDAKKLPYPEHHIVHALQEQMHLILEKMRRAGLIRV